MFTVENRLSHGASDGVLPQALISAAQPAVDWRAFAITTYQQRRTHADMALRLSLADRVHTLTGREIALETIWLDRDEQVALAMVDSILFRYAGEQLIVLRPCALCGSGRFTSPPVTSRADVGYALSVWQPRHPECQPDDAINWLDNNE
jgi:hypothetical protein